MFFNQVILLTIFFIAVLLFYAKREGPETDMVCGFKSHQLSGFAVTPCKRSLVPAALPHPPTVHVCLRRPEKPERFQTLRRS